jgi:hypothetical protein
MRPRSGSVFLALTLLVLAVGAEFNAPAPVLKRGEHWGEMLAVAKLPENARRTLANRLWFSKYLEAFSLAERRLPNDYEDLSSSVYYPTPNVLMNPYANRPAGPSDTPSLGDFTWKMGSGVDRKGLQTRWVEVSFFYDPDGLGRTVWPTIARFSDQEIRMSTADFWKTLKTIADGLSPKEQRLFWLCRNLDIQVDFATKNLLGVVPASIDPFLAIDWFFPYHRIPNLWTGHPMKAVTSKNPTPGDFTYSRMFANPRDPTIPVLVCHGDDRRVVWPWDWNLRMQSEALRKSATGDTRDLWPLP